MHGLDGEEICYYNFNPNKTVVVLPEFVDSELFGFFKYFETGIHNSQICKEYLAIGTKAYANHAEQMGKSHTHNLYIYCIWMMDQVNQWKL